MKTPSVYHVCRGVPNTGDGSAANPFPTLRHAREAIRGLKASAGLPNGGITVLVRGGEYGLSESLAYTAEDSGTAEAPIVYRAAEATPVLPEILPSAGT